MYVLGVLRARPNGITLKSLKWRCLYEPAATHDANERVGRWLLQGCGFGMLCAGVTILILGMTLVFVPQDLAFIGLNRDAICSLNPRLVPVIAHDRAGFGGGLFSIGILIMSAARHAVLTRNLVEVFALVGVTGFGSVLGVHQAVGYLDTFHLGPAWLAAVAYLTGCSALTLAWRSRRGSPR